MTDIARVSTAGMDASTGMFASQLTGSLYAGEALDAAAPCYIKASDGKVYMTDASANDEAAVVRGWTARATQVGQAVTLFGPGVRFRFGSGMTPGADLYASATAGALADAPDVGSPHPIAFAITATDIMTLPYRPRSVFVSAELTGTGSAQNVAHGLPGVPRKIFIAPTDLTPATLGSYVVTEGTHTSTNVVVTVTTGKKFKVWASL